MIAALVYPALIFTSNSTQLGEIAVPFYLFVSAVVGAYIGFATIDDKWMMQDRNRRKSNYSRDWHNDTFAIDPEDYRDNRRG